MRETFLEHSLILYLAAFYVGIFLKQISLVGRMPWSSGYGTRLII